MDPDFGAFWREATAIHTKGLANKRWAYMRRSHLALVEIFFRLLKKIQVTNTLEVGAFQAEFSRRFKRENPHAKSLAVEANPYNFAKFEPGVTKEGIVYHHAAILNQIGPCTLRLFDTEKDRKSGFIRGNNSIRIRAEKTDTTQVTVPGTTLDQLIRDFPAHDPHQATTALWIDVEGALDLVIEGAVETLPHIPVIFAETEMTPYWQGQALFPDIAKKLGAFGFDPFLRDAEYDPDQFNVIFVNRQLLAMKLLAPLKAEFKMRLTR